jgi:putative membrane protein
MKKLSFVFVLGIATMAFQACGDADHDNDSINSNTTAENRIDSTDAMEDKQNETSKFMVKAANGGMMEVELGNLAKEKATNASVKEFAAMIVKDHSNANDELKSLAATKSITLPATMDNDHRDHVSDLSNKSGNDFDKAYMDMMVSDHKKDVDMFEDILDDNDIAPEVKAFANKTLPVLKKHHEEARRIYDSLK